MIYTKTSCSVYRPEDISHTSPAIFSGDRDPTDGLWCDCYRENSELGSWKENRHFYNFEFDLSIDLYLYLPRNKIRGNKVQANSGTFFGNMCSDVDSLLSTLLNYSPESDFSYDIMTFIRAEMGRLKPDILIFNQGFWHLPELRENTNGFRTSLINEMKNVSSRVIWKETTAKCQDDLTGANVTDSRAFLKSLEEVGVEVFYAFSISNSSLHLHRKTTPVCWDGVHYYSVIYRDLNRRLIDFLL